MSIVLMGSTSGSCTLQEQAVAGTTTLTLPTFDGTVGLLVSGTAVASTSGTSIDFTSIPAGVRRITVMFSGVSTDGTSNPLVQLGDAGGIENTGYASSSVAAIAGGTTVGATYTTGFGIASNNAAAIGHGSMVLQKISSNIWVSNHSYGFSANSASSSGGGSKTLSDTLDRIRITTVNGTDTFDAGSINILYE
jgi:hypothetical protein